MTSKEHLNDNTAELLRETRQWAMTGVIDLTRLTSLYFRAKSRGTTVYEELMPDPIAYAEIRGHEREKARIRAEREENNSRSQNNPVQPGEVDVTEEVFARLGINRVTGKPLSR